MLVIEIGEIFEVLLGKDLEELVVYWVGVAESLDARNASEILEEVLR